jgi:hypothetical protein
MPKLTSYECSKCGANVNLTNLNVISKCPFCGNEFWVDDDFSERITQTAKGIDNLIANSVYDIKIPAIAEKVKMRDLAFFRTLNESIYMLEIRCKDAEKHIARNQYRIDHIENIVGQNYDDIDEKTVKPLSSYTKLLLIIIYICGFLSTLISPMVDPVYDHFTADALMTFIMGIVWPILYVISIVTSDTSDNGVTFGFYTASVVIPIIIWIILIIRTFYMKSDKENLGKKRDDKLVAEHNELKTENFRLSEDVFLLKRAIDQLKPIAIGSPIHKVTNQFNGLQTNEILEKIHFAYVRMGKANIDFEFACKGFIKGETHINIQNLSGDLQYGDLKALIKFAVQRIKTV